MKHARGFKGAFKTYYIQILKRDDLGSDFKVVFRELKFLLCHFGHVVDYEPPTMDSYCFTFGLTFNFCLFSSENESEISNVNHLANMDIYLLRVDVTWQCNH